MVQGALVEANTGKHLSALLRMNLAVTKFKKTAHDRVKAALREQDCYQGSDKHFKLSTGWLDAFTQEDRLAELVRETIMQEGEKLTQQDASRARLCAA